MTSAWWIMKSKTHTTQYVMCKTEVNLERGGPGIKEIVDSTQVNSIFEILEVRYMADLRNGVGGHRVPEGQIITSSEFTE